MFARYITFSGLRSLQLLRFGDSTALILFGLAFCFAVGNGVITPLFSLIFGNLVDSFSKTGSDIQSDINDKVLTLLYLSIAALFVGAGEVTFSAFSSKRQLTRGRLKVLDAVINHPLAWHQVTKSVEVVNETMCRDLPAIELGLHGMIKGIRHAVCCFAGLAVALNKGPVLTMLVLSIVLPALSISNYALKRTSKKYHEELRNLTRQSNTIVRETFSQIKTIASFNLESIFSHRYRSLLPALEKQSVISSILSGSETAIMAGIFSFSYALAIYYGAKKVADAEYSGGQVLSVLFASIMAGFSASEALPCLHSVWLSHRALDNISSTIFDCPNELQTEGCKDIDFNMDVQFNGITFAYPTSPDKVILSNFNLYIRANSSAAIVGPSGSGKSTIMNLLLKHYLVDKGSILIDGIDLSDVDTKFWRSNVAFIPQETSIFSGTILENIRLARPNASTEEVIEASQRARCHQFVEKMPNGYSTQLGNSNELSGGQRQRIGIARAFLRDASLFLVDEATSALDNKSEREIQDALATIFESGTKTAITIAHKLSTVMRMDTIIVMKGGQAVEEGTHQDLINKNGVYSSLVEAMHSADMSYHAGDETEDGLGNKERTRPILRDSVLRKKSVRLSIIPERIRRAIDKKQATESAKDESSTLNFTNLIKIVLEGSRRNKQILALVVCIMSSCAMGLQYPGFSLALAGSVEIYLRPSPDLIRSGGSKWGIIYTCIGFGCILAGTMQAISKAIIGQKLQTILQAMVFSKSVYFPIEWHEKVENDPSVIQSLLSCHSHNIQQAVTGKVSVILQTVVTLIASITIAFTASTTLTLVILAVFPLLLAAQIVQTWFKSHNYNNDRELINRYALEATKNIKEVLSFSMQCTIKTGFLRMLLKSDRNEHRTLIFSGMAYGCSQFMLYNTIGLAFWFGTKQVVSGQITVEDLMRAFCSLFFATFSIAQTSNQLTTIANASQSKEKLSKVLTSGGSHRLSGARLPICHGEIIFDNVTFSYPSRPDRLVFKHFSLQIPAKSSCALVGESGHGKSSCFGLLEAFYSPVEGLVKIDGVDINKLDKEWIRSIVSFVTQEPVIFEASIFDNIKYGNPLADRGSIVAAAKLACCHEFIETLPESYDTKLGEGNVQLSGGQKQRIAIARAILKKSSILLMDEPTAALDSHSEVQVQKSLKLAMEGRTSIFVAHRLNTIKDFDMIATIYRGRVLEKGTHEELLAMDGYYCYLIKTQGQ